MGESLIQDVVYGAITTAIVSYLYVLLRIGQLSWDDHKPMTIGYVSSMLLLWGYVAFSWLISVM